MVVRILIAIAGIAVAGCYDPPIDDCQFTCSSAQPDCPDDMGCDHGFCRPPGATGACGCPAVPAGCDDPFPIGTASCGTLCSTRTTWDGAVQACDGGWHLAILSPVTELDDVPAIALPHWVGAESRAPPEDGGWYWIDGTRVTSGWPGDLVPGGGGCAAIASNHRLVSNLCDSTNAYVCESP